jgi:hypothetical protein
VIEAVDPIKIDPTSMSDTCKSLTNLISCGCAYGCVLTTFSAGFADQALGSYLEIWVIPGQQVMVKCGD